MRKESGRDDLCLVGEVNRVGVNTMKEKYRVP